MTKIKRTPLPSPEILHGLFEYDPITGNLLWRVKVSRKVVVGSKVGCRRADGYILTSVQGVQYMAHRLIWVMAYGDDPGPIIDHIDGDPSNNRLENLRLATNGQNLANGVPRQRLPENVGLPKGVVYHKRFGLYQARLQKDGKQHSLGYHKTPEDAAIAYREGALVIHEEFARFS